MTPTWFKYAQRVGAKRFAWRAAHEAKTRLWPFRVTYPLMPRVSVPSHEAWLDSLGQENWLVRLAALTSDQKPILEERQAQELMSQALAACEGELCLFDHERVVVGRACDWNRHPLSQTTWPLLRADKVLRAAPQGEDIKGLWEIGRASPVALWLRATRQQGSLALFPEALRRRIVGFAEQNPAGYGAHWASGQESAIRWMMWCAGVAGLWRGADGVGMLPFWRATWAHGHELERGLDFARFGTPNNHVVCEVAALWVMGQVVSGVWPEVGQRWQNLASEVWRKDRLSGRFFYEDGGFCQASMNYHRFALQILVWWWCHMEDGEPIKQEIEQIARRSLSYLLVVMNKRGEVPNLGANDGAYLWRWSGCAHEDYRPLVQTLSVMSLGGKVLEEGEWDKELAWWFGEVEHPTCTLDVPRMVQARTSGVVMCREGKDCMLLRTGPLGGTASQQDMMHLDVWLGGEPVAIDAGSMSYCGATHLWHSGVEAHNHMLVDGEGATERLSQFTLGHRSSAPDLYVTDAWVRLSYSFSGAEVSRKVLLPRAKEQPWVVDDMMTPEVHLSGPCDVSLRWLLWGTAWEIKSTSECTTLVDKARGFVVRVFHEEGTSVMHHTVFVSRRYLHREEATQVVFSTWCSPNTRVQFRTEFHPCILS